MVKFIHCAISIFIILNSLFLSNNRVSSQPNEQLIESNIIDYDRPRHSDSRFTIAQYTWASGQQIPGGWTQITNIELKEIINTNPAHIQLIESNTKLVIMESGWYEIITGNGADERCGSFSIAITTYITQFNIRKSYGSTPATTCTINQNIIKEFIHEGTVLDFVWRSQNVALQTTTANTPEMLRISVHKLA